MILISRQHTQDASKHIRIFEPVGRLAAQYGVAVHALENEWDGQRLRPQAFASATALFLHLLDANLEDGQAVVAAVAAAKEAGVPVIVDTDDDYFRAADHGPFDASLAPHLVLMRRVLSMADVVTVTGPYLAERVRGLGPEVRIVPNVVEFGARRPGTAVRPRVGFAGGPTHLHDLRAIVPAVARVQAEVDMDFVLFGLYDREMSGTLERLRRLSAAEVETAGLQDVAAFAHAMQGIRYVHVPSAPYTRFMPTLTALDLTVGLCPLLDTPFNRCRSSVKFYQYAAAGTVALASDAGPYRDECAPLSPNTVDGWAGALVTLLTDHQARDAAQQAQDAQWQRRGRFPAVSAQYEQLLLSGTTQRQGQVG